MQPKPLEQIALLIEKYSDSTFDKELTSWMKSNNVDIQQSLTGMLESIPIDKMKEFTELVKNHMKKKMNK